MAGRFERKTLLIFCEGEADQTFLRHLRSIYCANQKPSAPKVSVKKGRGGSAHNLIIDAFRVPGLFTKRAVKLDSDRGKEEAEKAKQTATSKKINLLFSNPCLEALLLQILDPKTKISSWSSSKCKSEFERRFIPKLKRTQTSVYRDIFTKEILDEARARLPELDEIVVFMLG